MSDAASYGDGSALPPDFLAALKGLKLTRYGAAIGTTLYIYDILITLDLEVRHTWQRIRFNLPTLFYVLNRYISLIFFLSVVHGLSDFRGPLSNTYCRAPLMNIGLILAHASWTGIMALRVCALWKQRTKLVTFSWILWALANITVLVCAILSTIYQLPLFSYQEDARACVPDKELTNGLELVGLYGPIAPAVCETVFAALTIIKAFDFHSQTPNPSFRGLPFFYRVVARDGVLYFLVTVIITAVSLGFWFTHTGPELFFFLLVYWSLLSTVISRLALNLRQTYFESQQVATSASFGITNVTDGTNVQFGASAHLDRHCTPTLDDLDIQMTHMGPSDAADIERGLPTISEPEIAEDGGQHEVEQDVESTEPSLAMRRLHPRQDGVGVI